MLSADIYPGRATRGDSLFQTWREKGTGSSDYLFNDSYSSGDGANEREKWTNQKLKRNESIGIITEYKSRGGEKKLISIKKGDEWDDRLLH